MKNKRYNSEELKCAYPNCDNCNEIFGVQNCMLIAAQIDFIGYIITIKEKALTTYHNNRNCI